MAKNDYQALAEVSNPFVENSSQSHESVAIDDTTTDTENEDGHRDNGIMIHVVPDTGKGIRFLFFFLNPKHNDLLTSFLVLFFSVTQHDGIISKI